MKKLLACLAMFVLLPLTGYARQGAVPEQGEPPTTLSERGGFWTANGTPTNTESFQVHVVGAGDTLWALAGTYLENPMLWPQLWESNEHIVNPHWVYPQDSILIQPVTQITEAAAPPATEQAGTEPEQEPSPATVEQVEGPLTPVQLPNLTRELGPSTNSAVLFDVPEPRPAPTVKARDLYCSGFVTPREISNALSVIAKAPGTSTEGLFAVDGDYVYVSQGSAAGIAPGDMFTAVRPTRNLESPRDGVGNLGRHHLELGQLQVVTVQPNFSMARVVHSCDALTAGDSLVAFTEIALPEIPTQRPFAATMPSTGNITGAIVGAQSVMLIMDRSLGTRTTLAGNRSSHLRGLSGGIAGEGEIVYVDLGGRDGIAAGDVFLIYRPIQLNGYFAKVQSEFAGLLANERQIVGELIVLKVEERASTALVTFSSAAVQAGDLVELR